MNIKRLPVSRINPAPYNPRKDLKPDDAEYQRLVRSLDEFGCVEPLVWNQRTGNLVGGHQRFKVLLAQGAKAIEVSVVDLTLEKEKALNIALNKVAGEWDDDKLASLLAELAVVPEFDVEMSGFDGDEELLRRLGNWIGQHVFGPLRDKIRANLTQPATIIHVLVPPEAQDLLFRPFELARRRAGQGLRRQSRRVAGDARSLQAIDA